MQTKRLGCLSPSGVITAFVTILILAGYTYARGGLLYNPGPLSAKRGEALGGVASHAEIGGDCKACHPAPWEPARMVDRCVACHDGIATQLQNAASLHGKMMRTNTDLSCCHCHPEHRGADAPLTEMNNRTFPHEAVGYSLSGHRFTAAREPFTCDGCHRGNISTFALDSCQTCHRQMDSVFALAHSLTYGDACLDCHDGVDRFGKNFKHDLTFPLTGKHTDVICAKCHTDARALADFSNAPADCYACHKRDDNHNGKFGIDCGACHQTSAWETATFDHSKSNFPLIGRHVGLACEQCHMNNQFAGLSTACASCHADPAFHAGMFSLNCAECHTTDDWFARYNGPHPSFGEHGGIDHEGATCRDCHTQTLQTATCTKCHDGNNPGEGGGEGRGGRD